MFLYILKCNVSRMHFLQSVREICRKNAELRHCTCTLSFITFDLDDVRRPMYAVNCSNLNLTRLPSFLPENTTTFYAQHNQVIQHHHICGLG